MKLRVRTVNPTIQNPSANHDIPRNGNHEKDYDDLEIRALVVLPGAAAASAGGGGCEVSQNVKGSMRGGRGKGGVVPHLVNPPPRLCGLSTSLMQWGEGPVVCLAPPDHYSVPQAAGLDQKGCNFPARCVRGRVCHRPRTWIQWEPILWSWFLFRGRGPSSLDQGDFPCVLRARIVIR